MAKIPLEDNFTDILGKAQRGLKLTDEQLESQAGITPEQLQAVRAAAIDEKALRKLAPVLGLGAQALVDSARKAWEPHPIDVPGLVSFNTPYEDMTVNSYLVWDANSRAGAAFDTGAECVTMLAFAAKNNVDIKLILLTHTHPDHIAALAKLQKETGAPTYVCALERAPSATPFDAGKQFTIGGLQIESRQTSGHSAGGITYVVTGLAKPVAVVGDAIFAGSMGGGGVSWSDALRNNRKAIFSLPSATVLCPGHGPLTTVGEEKQHNPFYPEFQN